MHARSAERTKAASLTSLVVPAYNPGPSVEHSWAEIERFLGDAPGAWEVVFVCDGCTDGTAERLARLTRRTRAARVVSYHPNRGKGYAVRLGLSAALGAWRLFTDVDLAYGLDGVLRVARALWAGADVAVASRAHPDSRVLVPPRWQGYAYRRHLQGMAYAAIARLLLPIAARDTQAGLKGMSAAAAAALLPRLRCDGFSFDCELLTACARLGLGVSEVPVCLRVEGRGSTTGVLSAARMVRELWRVRRAWRRYAPVALPPPGPSPAEEVSLERHALVGRDG